MTTCINCDADLSPEDLVRHVRETRTVVHCPECNCLLGQYRDPGGGQFR